MHRFYSSIIDYDTELQSSLFGSKSTAQLVKFRFLLGGGVAALPIVRRCPVGYVNELRVPKPVEALLSFDQCLICIGRLTLFIKAFMTVSSQRICPLSRPDSSCVKL